MTPTPQAVPLVTLCVICYNHANYVRECLDSAVAQTWPQLEILVLDNGSSDASSQIISEWAATCRHPVRLFLETEVRGVCANLNPMLEAVSGEFVAFISADDFWFPDKTRRQVELLLERGPNYGVAYADAARVDGSGNRLQPESFIGAHREFATLPEGDVLQELLRAPFIPAMSTLIRREALQQMGAFDEMLVYEDYDALLRLAQHWLFAVDPEPLSGYRVLESSMIHTVAAQHQPAKLLSDARIMAKAAGNPNLDEKAVRNLHRRVVRLATEAAALTSGNAAIIRSLHELVPLPALRVLAAWQDQGGKISLEELQQKLKAADSLPLPQTEDDASWQKFFEQLDSPPSQRPPWWRRWFKT